MPATLKRAVALAALGLVLVLAVLWLTGGLATLDAQGMAAQRAFRDQLAGALRALRSGEGGAIWGLVALAFGYGVLHAAGPGHGKFLIGGYAVGRELPMTRLAAIAALASLAQATVAVLVVYGGIGLFGVTRDAIGVAGDGWMADLSHVMIACIGSWLIWRGARGLQGLRRAEPHDAHHHHHDHHHDHIGHHHDPAGVACDACGHRHGPTLAEVQAATNWREVAALVAGIAIRPCSGALLLLVLTWQLGLVWAGIAGAYAMGIGTAAVTVTVALLAASARQGATTGLPGLARMRALVPGLELVAGAAIATIAVSLLVRG